MNEKQAAQVSQAQGFVAALDQSGGSTPKALRLYGVAESAYANDDEMFDLLHALRARIVQSPAFKGDKVMGAILFEMTMNRDIAGKPSSQYLWQDRGAVPFLKIDKGLEEAADGVRLMKPIPDLGTLLPKARGLDVFGTKMRSVIDAASPAGIKAIVAQQFSVAKEVLSHGLMPIIEPEVTITITDKAQAEDILRAEILAQLDAMEAGQQVMLKLSLPTVANQYKSLIEHPAVMRVVALSGGYSRSEANTLLAQNAGIIASFSRALTEGLSAEQEDADFDETLKQTIDSVFTASVSG